MTGWRKFVNGAALVIVIGAIGMWLSSYTWPTDLGRAIIQSGRTHDDVSDIVARHLPSDLNGAIQGLRDMGFEEGNRYVGASYRHRPIPELNEVNKIERMMISDYNKMLDEHNAVMIKRFRKEIVLFGARDFKLYVYLMIKKNGTMTVYSRSYTSVIFP